MSNPFGVPPPPPPAVLQPRAAQPRPASPKRQPRPPRPPEPHAGRRRLALLLAFLAGAMVVFANLATWLHDEPLRPAAAETIAAETFDGVAAEITKRITANATEVLTPPAGENASAPRPVLEPRVVADVDEAARAAATAPGIRQAWQEQVRTALVEVDRVSAGELPSPATLTLTLETLPATRAAESALRERGYGLGIGRLTTDAFVVQVDAYDGSLDTLRTLGGLWWLFVLGAIGFGAASIAVAPRRWRMAVILGVDALVMLAGCLLLLPLLRGTAESRVRNSENAFVVRGAYDAVIESLRTQTLVWMVVVALLLAVAVVGSQIHKGARARESAGGARRRVEST